MNVSGTPLYDLNTINKIRAQALNPYLDKPFQWRSEYLPFVVGLSGLVIVTIIYNRKRKKKK